MMPSIKVEFLPYKNYRAMRLLEDVTFDVGDGRDLITVRQGFEFDGASVPRALWSWFPPIGRYTAAALVHDYLCRAVGHGVVISGVVSRADADKVFYKVLRSSGVSKFDANAMWASVRSAAVLFGWTKRGRFGKATSDAELMDWRP